MKLSKEDLKTGMIVVIKGGEVGTVLLGTANGDIVAGDTWFPLDSHTRRTITHVYQPLANCNYISAYVSKPMTLHHLRDTKCYSLVWSCEDVEQAIRDKENALERLMATKEELEKELEELRVGIW